MRAILIATGSRLGMESLSEHSPLSLIPLIDRPFLQHVVEFLVGQGITDFDFVLSHLPEQIEAFLGDGTRWGSSFRYHLARDSERPYHVLKQIQIENHDPYVLLVHTDCLPDVRLALPAEATEAEATDQVEPRPGAILFYWQRSELEPSSPQQWTGWAWLSRTSIPLLPDDADEESLSAFLLSLGDQTEACIEAIEVPEPLNIRSHRELLEAQYRALELPFFHHHMSGRETDKGIWLSRNISLHPTTKIKPPVYIGENCQIGMGTQLGPYAVIGKNCVLASGCTLEQSVIFPGSYVGEGLELVDAIVDKNRLINTRVGVEVEVADNFILGSMTDHHIQRWAGGLLSRLSAALLLLISWPLIVATVVYLKLTRSGPILFTKDVVSLPASSDATRWQTFPLWQFCSEPSQLSEERSASKAALREFFLCSLPALINVVRGDLRLVGVAPRTEDEIKALPSDWQALYLCTHSGIITEAYVYHGATPSADELYASEAYYSATVSIGHNLRLIYRYFGRMISSFLTKK